MKRLRAIWRLLPPWAELTIVTVAAILFLGVGASIAWATFIPLPAINNFESRAVAQSTKIYDRTGNIVLYDVHGNVRRTAVPLADISPYMQKASIAIEDSTFYTNWGFRPLAFMRAIFVNIQSGAYRQGGSTITQQVVKNALLTQDKTILRKIEEIILALRLTQKYSKDEILNTYLNESPYGGTVYGVEEASQYYFGVSAKDLDLAQSAYMAALPQAPTYFSPFGNHRADLDTRKNFVLLRMKQLNFITEEEYEHAKNEEVKFLGKGESGIKAPHFVFYVREYLEDRYGVDAVEQGGLRVVTTLDYDLQQKAEEVVAKHGPGMKANFNAGNEGIVAIEPSSGQILAMVGSRDFFDESIDGMVNVTVSHQQPGSSFKPIIYATALEKGYTPETMVFDLPTQFSTRCAPSDIGNSNPPCYSPGSFDGKFRGPVTFREALAQSLNTPAVKVLYLVGIRDAISMAERLGITTLNDIKNYGLSLVLGGGDVNLVEITGAYSVFANDGVRNPPTGILEVKDSKGKVLEKYEPQSMQVVDPQIVRQLNDILSDNVARTPEFGANSPLYFPGAHVAAKTGTTNDYWDVWILGYTPGITIGAWAGNNDNSPMEKRIASYIIAPMWHELMVYAMEKYPADDFPAPAPDPERDSLPPVLRGSYNTSPAQGIHEILYWIDKSSPRSFRANNPWSDPQTVYWDYPLQFWGGQQIDLNNFQVPGATTTGMNGEPVRPTPGTQGAQSGGESFQLISPQSGAVISAGSQITLTASGNSSQISSVAYFVSGTFVGASGQPPYAVTYTPQSAGGISIRAVAAQSDGSVKESTVQVMVQ